MPADDTRGSSMYDDVVVEQSLHRAVVFVAKRCQHMNRAGVGLGPTGRHEPGECGLCDALRDLEAHETRMAAK